MAEINWFVSILRTLCACLDWIVYTVLTLLFRAIFNLANFELVGLYESFEERIYVILGIFMLFKVTISMITYLVNPDKITDKEQGVAKVVTRIITVLVMLIALPTFFNLMTELQNKLLPVIPRVIIGTANTLSSEDAWGIANNMSTTMLQGFAHLKDDESVYGYTCEGAPIEDVDDLVANINKPCSGTNDDKYAYDYLPIVSTLVGIIACYVLFSMAISVAIRAFKLIILRAMAPIPIISYVDPKSAKDGAFSHWAKTFISTWAELFVNLGLIYFIVYIIDLLISGQFWKGFFDGISGPLAILDGAILLAFLIVGLLMFAKSAPQFIFDALGIKNKHSFTRMLGMGAAALGMGGSIASSLKTRNEYDKTNNENGKVNHLRNLGASLFSGLASGATAGNAILSSDKPNLMTGIDAQQKYNAQNLARISAGSTALGRLGSRMEMMFGGQTEYDSMNREKAGYEAANKALLQYKNTMEKKALEKDDLFIHFTAGGKTYGGEQGINYMEFMAHTEGAKNGNAASLQWFIDRGFSKMGEVNEEYQEQYKVQVGIENVWDNNTNEYVQVPKYETRTRTATRTVMKEIADWQGAQSYIDKIKDAQTQKHAERVVEAAEKYDEDGDTTVFTKYGTEYNDYRLATDAAHDVNLNVDFKKYAIPGADASQGDTVGVKQALGETNKKTTGIVTNKKYKAAKANAEATKKNG